MTDKCQCFPLNFQKNSWLFHSRDNIDPCYKHFCLPFPQSVERKLFQFWRGNAIRSMETLSRVKIIFSKKRGLFEDFEFWKFAFSSFLPSFRLFRFAQLVKIFFKWSRIDTNRLVQFCLTKLWINERTPLKEITIEKEVVKFNDRFINWKLQNSFAISSLSQGTIPVAREKVSRQWEDIYIAEDSVAKQITVKERGRQSYLELSWATLSRNNDLLFS